MAERIPLYYTFGNHMHWVDMEWLWGYHVLPGSVEDMLRFCREAGVKGNVNFDGIGYEKLASEAPEALAALREAVQSGLIEPVGCSYGQPYGLFHGGESNIRQRVYGVRSAMRLLGLRPRTFWEEEFDFFPQLPQMLRGVGFEYASVFFQWTWHTPEVPREDVPVVWWEGLDGSRLLTATRNDLNLHQWPEDMDVVLGQLSATSAEARKNGRVEADLEPADISASAPPSLQASAPLLLQWLELMPSPDWMCRSELILPKMRELMSDPRFEIKPCTLGEYLKAIDAPPPAPSPSGDGEGVTRRYSMDDVWHGMTLGKNGDDMRRRSIRAEGQLLTAETLAAMMGAFGRPYAQWDVYPTWELEEAWRELLAAQHHDNDECEGLCGHVGKFSYDRSLSLSGHVLQSNMKLLAKRVHAPKGSLVIFNPLGWSRNDTFLHPQTGVPVVVRDLPPMGYKCFGPDDLMEKGTAWTIDGDTAIGVRGDLHASFDRRDGGDMHFFIWKGEEGARVSARVQGGGIEYRDFVLTDMRISDPEGDLVLTYSHESGRGNVEAWVKLPQDNEALDITFKGKDIPRPGPGMASSLFAGFDTGPIERLLCDHPYGMSEVKDGSSGKKKYPTGDWMTSEQWFEDVYGAFTCTSFVNVSAANLPDTLIIHDGSQQWYKGNTNIICALTAYDPWDEDYFVDSFHCSFRLIPHSGMSQAEMWKRAQEFRRWPEVVIKQSEGGDLPKEFSFATCDFESTALTALYRETQDAGDRLVTYAGNGMDYPYIARVVELDGVEATAEIKVAGQVAKAVKTNLLGEPTGEPLGTMRPHEIATVYMDIVEGRKQVRDLDAKREVWATVHRVDD